MSIVFFMCDFFIDQLTQAVVSYTLELAVVSVGGAFTAANLAV
jgi:hypothetical protein